jgi:5'-nucleotidase
MSKPILYVDMDNVLVDFGSGLNQIPEAILKDYAGGFDEIPGIFSLMQPIKGAVDAIEQLAQRYEIYVLSTAPWLNPTAWSDKLLWIQKYFGTGSDSILYKRLILSHHKQLNRGDYLIDDRDANGADRFEGKLIKFGASPFEDWNKVRSHLIDI